MDETHAIHGGGLPLITKNEGFVGMLLISGLPQVEDHLLGVEVLTEFLARKGELCLLYTSPSPRDRQKSRMPSSA